MSLNRGSTPSGASWACARSVRCLLLFGLFGLPILRADPTLAQSNRNDSGNAVSGRSNSILKPVYFSTFRDFYRGEYERARKGFRAAGRSAIHTIESRWIDSICYHTMSGEVLYRQGDLKQASHHYESALRLYVQYSDWMLRMKFPDSIAPDVAPRPLPNWGKSNRRYRLGRFPDKFSISRSGQRVARGPGGQTAIVNAQQLHGLHVDELVRCTVLAIRRHTELMGPKAKHDQLSQNVLTKLTSRQGPANHWSEIWLDLQLGMGFAAAGKTEQAVSLLQRSMLAGGEFDHPLTCLAMLELGRLAMRQANYKVAGNWFNEAAISAYFFDRYEVAEESLRLMQLVYMLTGNKGVHPSIAGATAWANRKGLHEMYASLLIAAAEGYVVSGDLKRAESTLGQARHAIGRGDMVRGRIGARFNYITSVVLHRSGNPKAAGEALAAAIAFQRNGSIRLFQIVNVDKAYVDGTVRERVALDLYSDVLSDPAPIVWRHRPLEALSQLLIPQTNAFEHWFDAAIKREDVMVALDVIDRMRRVRFYSSLPMGGRLLNLRWVLQGPPAALPQAALLQRNDLSDRYPNFTALAREAQSLVDKLREQALLPDDNDKAREQAKLLKKRAAISAKQDVELLEISVRREPVKMVFPPLNSALELQKQLAEGQAILVFHAAPREHHAFLLTNQRYGHWKIASPANVKNRLVTLLRAMGHYDQSRVVSTKQLADTKWHVAAKDLLDEITSGARIDLGKGIDDLTIVPDGLYWYVPFEALHVGNSSNTKPLLSRTRIRYAPTLGLTVPDGRARRQSGDYAVVLGRLFPREDEAFSLRAFDGLRQVLPRAHAIDRQLLAPTNALAGLLDGLVVLDDIEPAGNDPLSVAPFRVDKGRPGSSIQQWMSLPWGSPDVVVLPGYHTPAENSLKKMATVSRAGNELFLTSMGLFATGSRTVMLSRWRTGGQMTTNLIREFLRELPNTTAQDAWQRAVQIANETVVDATLEPRVKSDKDAERVTALHPFLWSGYVVIDWGPQKRQPPDKPADDQAGKPAELKFPG